MKGSLTVFVCFVAGCLIGVFIKPDFDFHRLSLILLYLLMIQVGFSIGANPMLPEILKKISVKDLLLPIGTVGGALIFSAVAALIFNELKLSQILAVNYSCGYYSMASILINQLTAPSLGEIVAAELATIALLTNVMRELMALIFAPFLSRRLGPYAMIGAAGVTSTDVCLPAIIRYNGDSFTGIAIIHGILIDISTPFFLTLFCQP